MEEYGKELSIYNSVPGKGERNTDIRYWWWMKEQNYRYTIVVVDDEGFDGKRHTYICHAYCYFKC